VFFADRHADQLLAQSGDADDGAFAEMKLCARLIQDLFAIDFSAHIGGDSIIEFGLALDRLAATDLASQLAYQDAVRRYHERLKAHFLPILFAAAPIPQVDWERVPSFEPAAPAGQASEAGFPAAAALVLASICALLVAGIRATRAPGRAEPAQSGLTDHPGRRIPGGYR